MRQSFLNRPALVLSVLCSLLFPGLAARAAGITVDGIVYSVNEIITSDDTVYAIADTAKGQEVLDLVFSRVQVIGEVQQPENGPPVITVRSYQVLDDSAVDEMGDDGSTAELPALEDGGDADTQNLYQDDDPEQDPDDYNGNEDLRLEERPPTD